MLQMRFNICSRLHVNIFYASVLPVTGCFLIENITFPKTLYLCVSKLFYR